MATTPLTAVDVRQLIEFICNNDINVFTGEYYDLYLGIRDGNSRLIMPSELGLSDRLVVGINSASRNRHVNIAAFRSANEAQFGHDITIIYKSPGGKTNTVFLQAKCSSYLDDLQGPPRAPCADFRTMSGANAQRRLLYNCVHNFQLAQAGDTVKGGYVVYSKNATFFANIDEVNNCEQLNPGWFANPGDLTNNTNISNYLFNTIAGGPRYTNSTAGTYGTNRVI